MKNILKNPLTVDLAHRLRAWWAIWRHGRPGRQLYVIGVTGTKGKTTTVHLISHILTAAGQRTGHLSTVEFKVGAKRVGNDTNKTTLPPAVLQQLLAEMVGRSCRYAVLEISSHGLAQHRVAGIPFKMAVLTNVSHDHLDYHGTFEEYRQQKITLFQKPTLQHAVVNGDDKSAPQFLQATAAQDKYLYSLNNTAVSGMPATVVRAANVSLNPTGSTFRLVHDLGSIQIKLKLPGLFNIQNALAAAAVGLALNLKLGTIKQGLESVEQIPGRMEKIETKRGFAVIVDYAHTPDSMEQILKTLRPIVRGKIIIVFGATGDRDRTKRPIMGAIAARYADYLILTDEEPYSEDPQKIINEIAKGVPRGRALFARKNTPARPRRVEMKVLDVREFLKREGQSSGENEWWWRVLDRREAITKAIAMAGFDDLILVTGMGAQNYKIVRGKKEPWKDRAVIEEILRKKKYLS